MWAALPPNQWSQLKMGRLLAVGAGRKRAPIGCRKQIIVVIDPKIAWGFCSADQPPISRNISTEAVIESNHVNTMQPRCHWKLENLINISYLHLYCTFAFVIVRTANHWSFPQSWLPTQVCLKYLFGDREQIYLCLNCYYAALNVIYLANKIPIDAVPIHAVNINAAWSLMNNFDLPPIIDTSAKFVGAPAAIRPMSW